MNKIKVVNNKIIPFVSDDVEINDNSITVIKRGTPYVETDNYRNGKNKQPGVN